MVIPTRGGRERLPVLLAALERQTHPDVEVVVVIDGDVDDTVGLAPEWDDRLPVRWIVFAENQGRSRALNAGFAKATGDVLIRCDDDLEPGEEHVARHVAHHGHGTPVGVIGLCPNLLPDTPYARVYGTSRDARFRSDAFAMPADQRWRLWGANVSVTRPTWDLIGGYDPAYRAYGFEDVDWGYRLHRAGVPLVLDAALDATHRGAATTTEIRALRAYHSGAAQRTFERIHGAGTLGTLRRAKGLWSRSTHAAGALLGASGVARLARIADRVSDHVPVGAAEKAVAFVVESAAEAGRQHPQSVDHTI